MYNFSTALFIPDFTIVSLRLLNWTYSQVDRLFDAYHTSLLIYIVEDINEQQRAKGIHESISLATMGR